MQLNKRLNHTLSTLSVGFFILTISLILSNSIIYPTITDRYLGISSLAIFSIYSILFITSLLFSSSPINQRLTRFNNHLLLPLTLILGTVFIALDIIIYPNFVLQYFHIFPTSFIYIPLISLVIKFVSNSPPLPLLQKLAKVIFPSSLYYSFISGSIITIYSCNL
jgi:hypothetical protein